MMQSITLSEAKSMFAQERIEQLKTLAEQTVDTSDIPELTQDDFFKCTAPLKSRFQSVLIRILLYGLNHTARDIKAG